MFNLLDAYFLDKNLLDACLSWGGSKKSEIWQKKKTPHHPIKHTLAQYSIIRFHGKNKDGKTWSK